MPIQLSGVTITGGVFFNGVTTTLLVEYIVVAGGGAYSTGGMVSGGCGAGWLS